MRQADKIGSQLFSPAEQSRCILPAVSAAAAKRRFLMNTNAAKKNRFSIKQDFAASGFNAAKTDLVLHAIVISFDRHPVKFGIRRRPERQVCRKIDLCIAVRIRRY